MNQITRRICGALILSCMLSGYAGLAAGQTSGSNNPAAIVQRIMTAALSRCYSTVNGVRRIAFEPATNEEVAEVKALGEEAIGPLSTYIDLKPRDDLSQLLAVKLLMAIGGTSTLNSLKRAFAEDQWEVTRAAALSGIFAVSQKKGTA
jgi:hypothetical protein